MAAAVVAGAELNREAIADRLDRGYLDATTLMEYLIARGVPQRTAHEIIGRLVALAMKRGLPLASLELSDFQAAHADLDASVYDVLGVERAVAAFVSEGSTAPAEVAKQLAHWEQKLKP
jgi:argininosuccinate lyase